MKNRILSLLNWGHHRSEKPAKENPSISSDCKMMEREMEESPERIKRNRRIAFEAFIEEGDVVAGEIGFNGDILNYTGLTAKEYLDWLSFRGIPDCFQQRDGVWGLYREKEEIKAIESQLQPCPWCGGTPLLSCVTSYVPFSSEEPPACVFTVRVTCENKFCPVKPNLKASSRDRRLPDETIENEIKFTALKKWNSWKSFSI